MTESQSEAQFSPRIRNNVYPYIYPVKYRGALKDKVTIITGSAGTLGKALAECFAVAGATLVLVYNRTDPGEKLRERCIELGAASVTFKQCNVIHAESCDGLVKDILDAFGRADIIVNNAGANSLVPMHEQDPQDFIYEMNVNFTGPYYLMRLLLPSFRKQGSGCILNIASRAGTVAIPYSTSYCASKAALINLTACVQKECAMEGLDGLHMYALHPGGVKSEMTLKKYGEESLKNLPPDVAKRFTNWLDIYTDSPYLNGMVCVALATGIAKEALNGKYFDVGHDLEDVVAQTSALKQNPDLYSLHTKFLGGLGNTAFADEAIQTDEFDFPGF